MHIHEKYVLVATSPKGQVIPNVQAEQVAAASLAELTDEQFMRVEKAAADHLPWARRAELTNSVSIQRINASQARQAAAK